MSHPVQKHAMIFENDSETVKLKLHQKDSKICKAYFE